MQTQLPSSVKNTRWGQLADRILRNCVHCGFCTATCPTYQLLGDELDGPRGRIYQIKQFLETGDVSRKTQQHLDRCLTCRSCETTCPSGVEYAQLLDIGREQVEKVVSRPLHQRLLRFMLRKLFTSGVIFKTMINTAQLFRSILPASIQANLPDENIQVQPFKASTPATRKMVILDGCVQPALSPEINAAAKNILSELGIELLPVAGCCGAIEHHLSASKKAQQRIRDNIDRWWQYLDDGAEVIISTASGCGVMVKDYHKIIEDETYLEKARIISERTKDISQVISDELENIRLDKWRLPTIAFHSPCTLQHGQKLNGVVETILSQLGFKLGSVTDSHLCCGSAGTYSILQKEISEQLKQNKLNALQASQPEIIATANIGCLLHLRSGTDTQVMHWINLVDQYLHTRQ